jgi:hypothetical protein
MSTVTDVAGQTGRPTLLIFSGTISVGRGDQLHLEVQFGKP